MTTHTIEQRTRYGWEPIPEGDFDTLEDAEAALDELEQKLGWTGMRLVSNGEVLAYGTPHPIPDADEDYVKDL